MREVLLEITLHFVVAELVSCLKSSVFFAVLLDRIIRKMNVLVFEVLESVEEAACANVAILVEVAFKSSVNGSQHCVHSHIEFTVVNQKRPFDILLHNHSRPLCIGILIAI